ncbi:MAG: hypothetical protein ACFB0E_03035 [Leptolyngbyaceae cyanobacterium]
MLNTSNLREQVHDYVEQLPPERLAVVLDFLAYLVEREDNDATAELLAIPGFTTELETAEREADAGELTDWHMIRNDVSSR